MGLNRATYGLILSDYSSSRFPIGAIVFKPTFLPISIPIKESEDHIAIVYVNMLNGSIYSCPKTLYIMRAALKK